ncbi:unnamed protein product [Closterium sp. NIES-65]|nr:unnamed protein product [Closterium sp. NIES-65]
MASRSPLNMRALLCLLSIAVPILVALVLGVQSREFSSTVTASGGETPRTPLHVVFYGTWDDAHRPRRRPSAAPSPPFRGPVAALSAAPSPPFRGPVAALSAAPSPPFRGPVAVLQRPRRRSLAATTPPFTAPPSRLRCRAAEPPNCRAAEPPSHQAAEPPSRLCCRAAEPPLPPSRTAAEAPPPVGLPGTASLARVLTFDAEVRAVDFEVWVDDLQLFLQCDRADGLSLFDLTSGASPAPAADADATVRSQWATRDAAARLPVRRHLPTAERAHFSQYKSAQTLGVPPPPSCPLLPLLLRPTSLVLSRSALRLPRAGDAAPARARGARALEGLAGAVEVVVEAVEGVGVEVGVVAGVEVSVAAVEAEEVAAVAEGAEAAEVVDAAEAAAAAVDLVAALRRGVAPVVRGRGTGPCTYVLRTGDRTREQCGGPHSTQRCFGRLTDAWRHQFPEASEIPRWGELSRAGVSIFDLDFDAILAAMYAVDDSVAGDCYLCVPPDPGIEAAALGAIASTAPDRTTLTSLSRPVAVSLADPSGGPVLAHFSTVLPCPAAPSGTLSGLYLPSFSTNLVSGADLQGRGVDQFTPASQRVTHCTCARTGRQLATFTRRLGSSLYTLTTESPPAAESG